MLNKPTFREIYDSHSEMVYNLALNYLQNTQDAEEVTQDVFVTIHQKIEIFNNKSSLKTWIYRITINKCLDFIKAKKRQKRFGKMISVFKTEKGEKQIEIPDFSHPGVLLEDKEEVEFIFSKINELPDKQKSALILKTIEGVSQKEISAVLGVTEKAIESLLSRARANLKKKL